MYILMLWIFFIYLFIYFVLCLQCLPLCLYHLHSGQNIGVLEVVTVADAPSSTSKPGAMHHLPVPEHLSPLQQQQLNGLFKEFSDVFSQGEDDLGCTPLLEHTIETHGPPLRQPYWRQPQLFDGRRWRRSSKCWPATSSAPPTAPGLRRW